MNLPQSVKRWAFYDFANSSYILIYGSFLLPVFFATVLLSKGYSLAAWGLANGISTVIGVVMAIIVGKYSDLHSKFHAFRWAIIISFVGMVVLSLAVKYSPQNVYHLFIFTNAVFILSLALSDSILPHVSTKAEASEYSGFAWGFGYVGGMASLIIVLIIQKLTNNDYSFFTFLSVAIFYILFSHYSLSGLRKVRLNEPEPPEKPSIISRNKKIVLFIGYWLISECITVILLFFSIFASQELHLSNTKIGGLLLLVQLIAFPATWYGGVLAKKYSNLLLLGMTILCWGAAIVLLLLPPSIIILLIIAVFGGLAVGNSQSIIRAQYSTIIYKSESGFQFGIYSIISEAAVFVGPVIYGFASDKLRSQKMPLLGLFVLMVLGYVLVWLIMKKIEPKLKLAA